MQRQFLGEINLCVGHLQHQKCLAHILRNISDVIASHQGKRGRGELYGKSLQILFSRKLGNP